MRALRKEARHLGKLGELCVGICDALRGALVAVSCVGLEEGLETPLLGLIVLVGLAMLRYTIAACWPLQRARRPRCTGAR